MKRLVASFTCLLATALLPAADKADDKAARLEKARASLKSGDVEVRRKTLGSLNHSDLSSSLVKEMLESLKDKDGEVRSMAATAASAPHRTRPRLPPPLTGSGSTRPACAARSRSGTRRRRQRWKS
jgi:hypothetical protein